MLLLESLGSFNLDSKFMGKSKSSLFLLSIIEALIESIIYQALPAFNPKLAIVFVVSVETSKKSAYLETEA
jgi:hypothetical protein